ncbi:MAG: ATP-binding cassette domain-containing protein [Microscillaceae bacterium]|nr:ATP-binding cassette domain-containing protein [Microscillaceae bacterium]MDW8459572.1 ATP-binding cassette domain-containing protein [Cytophagales bacterium]
MLSIHLQNIGKKYQKEWIFRNFTWQFNSQESYAIVGGNGSGKSTLMQILAGILTANEGTTTYEYQQKNISAEEIFSHLAWVSPHTELIEDFTLAEMIDFQRKFKPFQQNISTRTLAQAMYLETQMHKPIKYFSSGMKQRLKLGLAFWADCPLLLLDEPCSNLDQQAIDWYLTHVKSNAQSKLCVIASNQSYEYDFVSQIIHIQHFK